MAQLEVIESLGLSSGVLEPVFLDLQAHSCKNQEGW